MLKHVRSAAAIRPRVGAAFLSRQRPQDHEIKTKQNGNLEGTLGGAISPPRLPLSRWTLR